jgi:hypothetical protein
MSTASGCCVPGVQRTCKLFACYAPHRFELCWKSGTTPCDALATLLLCRIYSDVHKGAVALLTCVVAAQSLTQGRHAGVVTLGGSPDF